MNILRECVREILNEITKLPKEYFTEIDNAITSSAFWKETNTQDDIDYIDTTAGNVMGTPAAEALQVALQEVLENLGLDMDVLVRSHDTDDLEKMTLHPKHPAYPNRWLVDASWYVSKENPGRNTIDIEMMTSEEEIPELNSGALMRHVSQTIRHELVHWTQMKKQAASKGDLSDTEAFEEMLNDPKQIPDSETGTVEDYLHSHIEIDAHAHDGAEEMLAVYGEEGAMDQLRGGFDLSDPKLPNAVKHYYEILPKDDPTLDKLKGKMYSYMQYFLEKE